MSGQYNKLYYCLRHFSLCDHRVIYAESLIPVYDSSIVKIYQNTSSTRIGILDFNKSNWPKLKESLNTIDWPTTFCGTPANVYIDVTINTISKKMYYVCSTKQSPKSKVSRFHHERKIIMRKRLKLVKSSKPAPLIKSHLVMLEKQLCDSHLDENRFEENAAVTKVKYDPNYFFRYAKKFSICKTDISPLMNQDTNSLSNDKLEMCRLLVDQFTSVFTILDPKHIITDPVSFFTHQHTTGINKSLSLTDIMLNEDIIIEAIHELSPNSAAGPDCVPSSLVNGVTELAHVLLLFFSHSLSHGVILKFFEDSCYYSDLQSGDKTVPSNYRPSSLTSVICKVLERMIRNQVFSFLDQNGCLNSTQHGFRPGRSCLSALLDVFDNIKHMLDSNSSVDMVYLDFSNAFDKVDHPFT